MSNKEQLSLVLRYVEPDTLLVREDLVGFFECDTGISGRTLADKITSCVRAYGLDLSNLRGQAYDGEGNMAGLVNGTAALIASDYPLAIYLHCTSHCLNLVWRYTFTALHTASILSGDIPSLHFTLPQSCLAIYLHCTSHCLNLVWRYTFIALHTASILSGDIPSLHFTLPQSCLVIYLHCTSHCLNLVW